MSIIEDNCNTIQVVGYKFLNYFAVFKLIGALISDSKYFCCKSILYLLILTQKVGTVTIWLPAHCYLNGKHSGT